jgi:DNA-binding CsgD family transcriptional regulator
VRAFTEKLRAQQPVLWGGCEALFTPRPLGPIVDMASALPPGLAARIHDGHTYNGLFPALLEHLSERARPSVVVIDDAHWADESTLDWIKYTGRRIERAPILLILTMRDEEVGIEHPLRRVLAELPAAATRRMQVAPLSTSAIETLARTRGRDAALLARLTSGNAFYVTELLASDAGTLPGSVRDAVLARVGRLSDAARRVADWVAIEPGRLERGLLDALGASEDAVREVLANGILQADEHALRFRHEIARQTVESELPATRRVRLHAQLLQAMQANPHGGVNLSRLVHHAHAAGLKDDVAILAPRAADEAARDGAHRNAAALYRLAVASVEQNDPAVRATLLEAAANELQLTRAFAEAITLREQALVLRRQLGDLLRAGSNLRLIGVVHSQLGRETEYLEYAQAAAAQLEPLGATGELAKAYASLSDAHCLLSNYDTAITFGEQAVSLAEQLDDPAARVLALSRLGAAHLCRADDADARAQVERALSLAIELRFEGLAATSFVSLQTQAINHHDYAYALELAARGLAYCEARDLDGFVANLRARRAYVLLQLGRWDECQAEYEACLAMPNLPPQIANSARYSLQRIVLRRGADDADATAAVRRDGEVDRYWRELQERMHTLQIGFRPPALAAACAEAAWLRRDPATAIDLLQQGLEQAQLTRDGRLGGPLLVWLRRLGAPVPQFEGVLQQPFALELAGDTAAAAQAWQRLNNPYEQALVLAFGDTEQMRGSLKILESLGAHRTARSVRAMLRALGERAVSRGPYRRTRDDEQGLTPREREVFELVAQGFSNQVIAQRLHRSERTVEHHVSAILAKSGVRTRAELIALASRNAPKPV